VALREQERDAFLDVAALWWIALVVGFFWFVIALVVLRIDETSITTVGVILGVVLVFSAFAELLAAGFTRGGGWVFWHSVLGLLFLLAGIWAFTQPKQAFWALASVLGFMLVLVGAFEIARSLALKDEDSLWWLTLIAGILFIALAFWTSQQLDPVKGQLLLFIIGVFALIRGVTQIAFGFALRSMGNTVAAS